MDHRSATIGDSANDVDRIARLEAKIVALESTIARLDQEPAARPRIAGADDDETSSRRSLLRTAALAAGGAALPEPVRRLMALTSKVMTKTAYWL